MSPAEKIEEMVKRISAATSWNARVSLIREIPEAFGKAVHQKIYAAVAESVYVPHLAPDFAYVHWREDYELPQVEAGLGWRRTQDALGPVVRDTDGRVFTVQTLPEMMTVEPFPGLRG